MRLIGPAILPPGWESCEVPGPLAECGLPCAAFARSDNRLRVLMSVEPHEAGTRWLHMSVSTPTRSPTWEELLFCKRAFLGDVEAVQIFPRAVDYINAHPFCHHLFTRLDGDTVPGNPQRQR